MLNLNETIVYGTTGVCTVENIEEKRIGKVTRKYYVLKPSLQSSAKVYVPADNDKLLGRIRRVISPEEIKRVVGELPEKKDIWIENEGERRVRYSEIISSGDSLRCLVLLRTLYNRRKILSESSRRLHIFDEKVMKEVERLVFDEFSVALNIPPENVPGMIGKELGEMKEL